MAKSKSRMPSIYDPTHGTPFYWRDEQSGELGSAVLAYTGFMAGMVRGVSPGELELVADYCRYYIAAPCWMQSAWEHGNAEAIATVQRLFDLAQTLTTAQDIATWIRACLEIGLDPL